jgi:selenocysteine lyase/cysteine desulfurase
MKVSLLSLIRTHLRIGYVGALLLFDAPLVVLILWDVSNYRNARLSLRPLLTPYLKDLFLSQGAWAQVVGALGVLLLLLPVGLAFVRVRRGSVVGPGAEAPVRTKLAALAGARNGWVVVAHLVLSILVAILIPVAKCMEIISGKSASCASGAYHYHYYFSSYYYAFVDFCSRIWVWLPIGAISAIVAVLYEALPTWRKKEDWLEDYYVRSSLADLRGELYPVGGRHNLNFNAVVLTQETEFVTRRVEQLVSRYYDLFARGGDAAGYLNEKAEESRELLRKMLWKGQNGSSYAIEYFLGTSRALEVVLLRVPMPKKIVLSPFEHPSEEHVSRWHLRAAGAEPVRINFGADDFSAEWMAQEDKIIQQLKDHAADSHGSIIFLLSEVCYATGLVIPVKAVIARLRRELPSTAFKFVVDGAHSVGNGDRHYAIEDSDFYIFSGHKWLLSPEPCGILISSSANGPPQASYDSWRDSVPQMTVSPRIVASILASLELLGGGRAKYIWQRSADLRQRFEDHLKAQDCPLRVVGPEKGLDKTFMLAVKPKGDRSWKYDAPGLRDYFTRNFIHVAVMELDDNMPWVRIAFPYFLDSSHIERLYDALTKVIS